jgi:hypothetical protein
MSISPPPYRDKDLTSQAWQKWFASITDALKTVAATLTSWTSINKAGSNLTDIETRRHDDLQNLNTATHTHLTASQYSELTSGGITSLHGHNTSSMMGAPGMDGQDGEDGLTIPGAAGKDGTNGAIGPTGNDGEDGDMGYILLQPINTGGGTGITIAQARAITSLRL